MLHLCINSHHHGGEKQTWFHQNGENGDGDYEIVGGGGRSPHLCSCTLQCHLRPEIGLNTFPTNSCASIAILRSMCRCIMFFFLKGWIPWSWQDHGQLRLDIQTQFSLQKLRRARRDQSACSPAMCFGQRWTRCCTNNIVGWEVEKALARLNQHLLFTLYVRCSLLLSE